MAVSCKAFGSFPKAIADDVCATLHASATLKMALTTDAPNQDTWTVFADITNEIADASYTAGGVALTGVTWTEAAKVSTLNADDVVFPALNKAFAYGVVYDNAPVTKPLIAFVNCDGTITPVTEDTTIVWPVGGILTHTVA